MLKKEHVEAVAKLLKLKPEDLTAAIADANEVDITVPEGTLFAETEIETLKTNEYKRGSVAAVEIQVKDAKEKLGLDFKGKTIDGLIEAAQKKALEDAKIEPAKKVQELEEKLKTVQATAADLQTKLTDKDTEIASVKLHTELVKNVPEGTLLEPDEVVALMKAKGYDFKTVDGKLVATKDGKVIEDKVANPLEVKDVISSFAKEKKLISEEPEPPAGRGKGNGKPAGTVAGSLTELMEEFKAAGKSVQGEEFSAAVEKARTANKEFKME
jgi:hypothetical protein